MASKYFVGPTASERGMFPKLAGLGELIGRGRENKRKEQEKADQERILQEAREKAQEAIASGDPVAFAEVVTEFPQLREAMEAAKGFSDEMRDQQQEEETRFYREVLGDPANAAARTQERVEYLQSNNRNADQALGLLNDFQTDPAQGIKNAEFMYGAADFEEFKKYQEAIAADTDEATAALKTLEGRALAAGLTEGTPEYQAFMLQGGAPPGAMQTLQARAEAAGMKAGTPEYQEFMRYGGAPPAAGEADQRARKIKEYQELFNLSVEDATKAVDARPMMDDKGNLITYDPVTGGARLVDVDVGEEQDVVQAPSGTAVEDLAFDPGAGTGFGASLIGLWNSTVGQIPFMPVGETAEEAAQNLRVLERDAISALASSGRPPVVEQQRIMAIVPQGMDWFENPEVARFKMTNFVDLMMNQYVDDMRYSQDRTNPKGVRETSAERANRIESIVRRVLTPEASEAMFSSLNRIETEIGEIRTMSMDDLLSLDAAQLTDSQLDIFIERMDSGR